MVAVVPAGEGNVLPESPIGVRIEAAFRRSSSPKQVRLIELRRAIESGEYRVSAADLADALRRAAGSVN
jgi:hypothetical protein